MANTGGGSFIPKRSTGRVAPARVGKRIYIFSYIAYVLFFGTLLSVVGIFFLHNQAEAQLQEYIARVDSARKAFEEQSQVNEIRELDAQLNTAEQVLNWHAAPSVIFDMLEQTIVQAIQLTDFTYTRQTGGEATLAFGGNSDSFDVLMFQREVMSQNSFLESADIVEVKYGGGDADTTAQTIQNPNLVVPQQQTRVTFSFQDITAVADGLGYTPRSLAVPTAEPEVTADTTEGNTATETEATDGEPQVLDWDPTQYSDQ